MLSDARGRFSFRITPDSAVVYLVSVRWSGIEYFATPFVVHVDSPTAPVVAVVSDTSATVPVQLIARHLIVSPPSPDGTRDVVDIFVLSNPGQLTRIAADSGGITWRAVLPRFAINVRAGNSEFAADAVRFENGETRLLAAIPPGQRDLEVDYEIPPNTARFEVPVDASAEISNIISADQQMRVSGAFTRSDTVIDRKPYARWQGSLTAGSAITLEFGAAKSPAWLVIIIVGTMLVVLAGATLVQLRRPPPLLASQTHHS
jgi:hypothetical protein